jgi:outer membrane lipoprotein
MIGENPLQYKGRTVVLGGTIIRAVTYKEGSELYILDLPLGARDRPDTGENPSGRFIAESKGYLDPLIYQKGRSVTIAGKVEGQKEVLEGKDKHPYNYPVVSIEEIHLWKRERPYTYYSYPYWWYGQYYGWPYYWGPGFYGGGYYGGEFEGGEDEEFEQGHEFDGNGGGFEGGEGGEHEQGEERGR